MQAWELETEQDSKVSTLGGYILVGVDVGYLIGEVLTEATIKLCDGMSVTNSDPGAAQNFKVVRMG